MKTGICIINYTVLAGDHKINITVGCKVLEPTSHFERSISKCKILLFGMRLKNSLLPDFYCVITQVYSQNG